MQLLNKQAEWLILVCIYRTHSVLLVLVRDILCNGYCVFVVAHVGSHSSYCCKNGYLVVIPFGKSSHITTISTHLPDSQEVPFFPYFKCGWSQVPQPRNKG